MADLSEGDAGGFENSISISRRVIFRADHQSTPFFGSTVNGLDNVDKFLLILEHPIQLIIIPSSKIAHHMLVSKEKHQGYRVVQF